MTPQPLQQSKEPPPIGFPSIRKNAPIFSAFSWLQLGWQDLRACGFASLFYGICFAIVGIALFLVFQNAIQWLTAVTTGFMLVGPCFAVGLYELSRRRQSGEALALIPTLTVWRRNLAGIGIYSGVLIILYLLWARASLVMFALFYNGGMPSLESFMEQLLKFDNIEFLIAYLAVGALFAGLVFAFSVVSIPMMLDRNLDTITAMIASFMALMANIPAMLVWGILIGLLTILGIATAFIGLIVTIPLIGHATWHAYRALIEPEVAAKPS